ncbi:aminotransferase class III-fold pyridoxal phosphate-dependent enzyme [Enterovirga rhinocerotis]|uniref:Glutamate-1-semialdehyde 2,1-aminomutase n=1 Tax=Enterovirga rhinocerotis TaxID=1339210 RepID=A0A4R7C5K7_9HYPH|nr:aminotransferase class III-fold pyridoxal phosphate-dependent enzyme [Enterovirga rhinocerotis]TDR93481.1 glutamate-1-semialdehyde 2,1-aminomutase [Enterovirga rhinocerotis]
MPIASSTLIASLLGATALAALVPKAARRLALSRAKHPSLAGHVRMAKRIAGWLPSYEFGEEDFFRSDDATGEVAERRRLAFRRLSEQLRDRTTATRRLTAEAAGGISDLQFTDRYRVPFPYRRLVNEALPLGTFVRSSEGPRLTDLDGNVAYDVSGSYGVNLFGYEFYKGALAEAEREAHALGPVLGPYHSVVADNVARLRAISGLDEVSFHMSGTEAVMQAVRLARYHTGRRRIVRFCGSYHGWWGDVQPGIGNPIPARDTLTLAEMSDRTLGVLAGRRDVACVLVNPLQALHPNAGAPADSSLVDSSRRAGFDRAAYADWLRRLREVCTARGIVLIFDEVFVGFRLAAGGAQEYFGTKADLVTYGKSLGGGLPVGVLCGKAALMRRFREDRPGDICFARGTFNSHPYVMTAMNAFLRHLETPEVQALYRDLDACWDGRVARLNERLAEERLPVRVAHLSSIWTIFYERPSRYNWMFQYYLRAEGLALSWVGTGRLIFSLDYGEADYTAVMDRFVAAALRMERDGWWAGGLATNKDIRRRILRETIAAWRGRSGAGSRPQRGEELRPAPTP